MRLIQSTILLLLTPTILGFLTQGTARPRYEHRMAEVVSEQVRLSDHVASALKKPSKTLAVVLDVISIDESRSMQLRKLKANALVTSDIEVAKLCLNEQATAKGNFPGPCPVLYTGSDFQEARAAGVDSVVVSPGDCEPGADVIYRVKSLEELRRVSNHDAFWVDVDNDLSTVQPVIEAIPKSVVVLASLKSMQENNNEISLARELKSLGVSAIVFQKAVVGDGEDLEYASFAVDSSTKKKSSTFNMTGLTGSTNGHFGGVASTQPKTWLRVIREM
jgi:hypothetical protein